MLGPSVLVQVLSPRPKTNDAWSHFMTALYWISTALISGIVLLSAASYFFHQGTIDGVRALGFPDFFRIQLGVMKIAGAIVLLLPKAPVRLKEWAYAGIGLFFITAIVAHTAHNDSFVLTLLNLVFIALLVASNISYYKIKT